MLSFNQNILRLRNYWPDKKHKVQMFCNKPWP